MTNQEIDKRIDDAAESEHQNSDGSIGYCPDCFKAGARFGIELERERSRMLVEALNKYACSYQQLVLMGPEVAKEAIAEYEATGGKTT